MAKTVFCKKYQKELEALDAPPMPGPRGEAIMANYSRQAWEAWRHQQTMLINEKHLNLLDPKNRAYLTEQMERFLNNEQTDQAEGYIPPDEQNS